MSDLSLLNDELFRVQTRDQTAQMTLPAILRALSRDVILSFDALQPHQEQAWYSFLVQLAAMTVVRANDGTTPDTAEEWRGALLSLADGNENAWRLVVPDVEKEPAFLQPPVPEGSLDDANFKSDIPSPSNLDVLVTSKNHDVKQRRISYPEPAHWIYALVTLQTMEGFLGRGNYGIVRMNGGFGNRPFVGLSPELSFGARFQRDLRVLVSEHDQLTDLFDPENGCSLLWIQPWDGPKKSNVTLSDCDPYVIEICRRIRFTKEKGDLVCWRANTKGQRIDVPDSLNGRTEDPWTPVDLDEDKALTLSGEGFTYETLREIFLSDRYAKPMTLHPHPEDAEAMYLTARAMVRGQGKTEGLHHRIIPIPEKVSVLLSDESAMKALAERAKARVKKTAKVESNVLRPAVAALLSAGTDEDVDWEQVQPWIDAFDDAVDDHFFDYLWASVEAEDEAEAEDKWEAFLRDEAEQQFDEAQDSVPLPDIRRWEALSAARSVFHSRIDDVLGSTANAPAA
ncbi:type I-E CRISPR-associated protein Cse1/CasA [Salinibacter altiplanensis]|uniref:type I-E CRISPR-associated protein Cse1/CasA n=1 Tax=Salinibacter altiplanensis TaxID=1803181 RepID=UPI000C9F1E61|nr:type I-E CRISPR-associated protein Cse1/CasA [Salinibacter altiplanensis]